MNQVSYTHPDTAKAPRYVVSSGRTLLLQPGDSAMVDVPDGVAELDGKAPAKKVKAVASVQKHDNPLQELLKLSVGKISEQLGEMDESQLTELLVLEKAAPTPRSTLIGEIDTRLLALKNAS